MDALKCRACGSEAIVTVMSETDEGQIRQFCRDCERRHRYDERSVPRHIASGSARVLVSVGLLLTLLAMTADHLAISGQEGFGWRQIVGVELGLLCIALSFFLAKVMPGVAGLFLIVLSLGADVFKIGHAPGAGWRTELALVLAIVLLTAGKLWQKALRRRH